jgi:hypothetical protein
MKRIEAEIHGEVKVYEIPGNCNHRSIAVADACNAPHHSHPDCDCRWCVFNKEYNSLNQAVVIYDEDED